MLFLIRDFDGVIIGQENFPGGEAARRKLGWGGGGGSGRGGGRGGVEFNTMIIKL